LWVEYEIKKMVFICKTRAGLKKRKMTVVAMLLWEPLTERARCKIQNCRDWSAVSEKYKYGWFIPRNFGATRKKPAGFVDFHFWAGITLAVRV
jgi:hypothetical protein